MGDSGIRRLIGTICAVLASSLLLGDLGSALAQDQDQDPVARSMDVLREHLDVDKKSVVEANLVLTKEQAQTFWPIYDEYQIELATLHERLGRVMRDYAAAYDGGTITNAQASALLDEAIAIDEAEVALRKATARRLKTVIPGIEAARYLQIENRIHAVLKVDLAEEMPLVE